MAYKLIDAVIWWLGSWPKDESLEDTLENQDWDGVVVRVTDMI